MKFDYFISHASEDKLLIVEPLAHYLQTVSFNTWYDEFCLRVGDSLVESIDKGLQNSKFGIVALSPNFFRKKWPQYELQKLIALEKAHKTQILPVWHHMTGIDIEKYSPELADRKAADTTKGLQVVAEQLVKASFPDKLSTLPLSTIVLTKKKDLTKAKKDLRHLLEKKASVSDVSLFLSGYPALITSVFGYSPMIIPGGKLPGPFQCDFAKVIPQGVTGAIEICLLRLGPIQYDSQSLQELTSDISLQLGVRVRQKRRPLNDLGGPYIGQYPALRELSEAVQSLLDCKNVHWQYPETWCLRFMTLIGRRSETPRDLREKIRRESKLPIDVASYDRLVDDHDTIYGNSGDG